LSRPFVLNRGPLGMEGVHGHGTFWCEDQRSIRSLSRLPKVTIMLEQMDDYIHADQHAKYGTRRSPRTFIVLTVLAQRLLSIWRYIGADVYLSLLFYTTCSIHPTSHSSNKPQAISNSLDTPLLFSISSDS